ncbi:MAG: primosomal protein N' [Oscillospiraceae bacterium]|nr:primosomal protein N' [Oscillospiraceae bacterium]
MNGGTEAVRFAAVAVERTAFHFDQCFDYRIPEALQGRALPGCRVTVPFGQGTGTRIGLILRVHNEPPENARLKSIKTLLDESPLLTEELSALVPWLKDRTFCTLYEAFRAMVPSGLHQRVQLTYSALPPESCPPEALLCEEGLALLQCARRARGKSNFVRREDLLKRCKLPADSALPERLAEQGFFLRNTDALRDAGDLTQRMYSLSETEEEPPFQLTARQAEVAELLRQNGAASARELCEYTGVSPSVLRALERKGVVRCWERELNRGVAVQNSQFTAHHDLPPEDIELTGEQQAAYDRLHDMMQAGQARTALLFGVTGSGKTSVYLRLLDDALAGNRSAIVMVPEIGLTPQLLELFRQRYGTRVALFHSALSVGERMDEWKRARSGEARLALGTRSAVFAPLENIGLIVLDEEHEHTYKSEQAPRYHARDAAKFRAGQNGALLLLASATPSVESYAAALKGRYALLTLENRFGPAELPEVRAVDLLAEQEKLLTTALTDALQETIAAGHQAILLMNRRGYNTFLACNSCKHVITCPQCSISLTYHLANQRVMCHYCGHSAPAPELCPLCGKRTIRFGGAGTQKIEEELRQRFPALRVARMDADSTGKKGAREELLARFRNREFDVLVGTQMVAKGLDFEHVTLVGVVSIDQILYHDDYRSQERCFGLLTQVVGRAGRGRWPGLALVQTVAPENEIIRLAARQDYPAFFHTELRLRRLMTYPPFCDLCLLGVAGEAEHLVKAGARCLLEMLREASQGEFSGEKLIVLGPMPARVSKLGNKFRWRLLVKCRNSSAFRGLVAQLLVRFGKDARFQSVTAYADMNPETIL